MPPLFFKNALNLKMGSDARESSFYYMNALNLKMGSDARESSFYYMTIEHCLYYFYFYF